MSHWKLETGSSNLIAMNSFEGKRRDGLSFLSPTGCLRLRDAVVRTILTFGWTIVFPFIVLWRLRGSVLSYYCGGDGLRMCAGYVVEAFPGACAFNPVGVIGKVGGVQNRLD
ncbi:hypothetical protein D3C80_906140 [compost metagenome]